jgi:hypothetical protein
VGDVVSIGSYCGGGSRKGIIFYPKCYPNQLAVTVCTGWTRLSGDVARLKKIGYASEMGTDPLETHEAHKLAKAYFAAPAFKVGDRVVFKNNPAGCTYAIVRIDALGNIRLDSVVGGINPSKLELVTEPTFTGLYEERQKQWIKRHGLKVGSKVRLVRKFENSENGWNNGSDWESCFEKFLGKELTIFACERLDIVLSTSELGFDYFPYFALEPA